MTPLLLMAALFAALWHPRWRRWPGGADAWQCAAGALGVGLVAAGLMHFLRPGLFLAMVPPGLPHPAAIVFWSGVAEVAVGLGLLVPRWRRRAAWAAVCLFLAIWPGSIAIAITGQYPSAPTDAPLYHWLRVPFHLLYVGWALWVARGHLPWRMPPARAT